MARHRHKFTEAEDTLLVKLYNDGLTGTQVAEQLRCGQVAVYQRLWKHGISPRSEGRGRRLRVNQAFFDVIDTEKKAYWLGFITADGNVNGTRDTMCISLASRDKEHLRKFVNDIESEAPITDFTRTTRGTVVFGSRVAIHSKKLCSALVNLGVTERKSFTVKPCDDIPEHLMRHYWRGVFDGDGCIYARQPSRSGYKKFEISLVGSMKIVGAFALFARGISNTTAKVHKKSNVFRVSCGGNSISKMVAGAMYKNATVFLDRKKKLFDELCIQVERIGWWSRVTKEQLETFHAEFITWENAARSLGVSRTLIYKTRKRFGMPISKEPI